VSFCTAVIVDPSSARSSIVEPPQLRRAANDASVTDTDSLRCREGLDVLSERWTLLIVRELLLGATTFTDTAAACPDPASHPLDPTAQPARAGIVEAATSDSRAAAPARAAGIGPRPGDAELARWAVDTTAPR